MARHYFGVGKETGHDVSGQVTLGTSSTGLEIEVSTLDGANVTKEDVYAALERIANYLLHDNTLTGGTSDLGL